jgi:dipeptidyl aminopeptidase/acylaminoacyl peptidase
LIEIFAEHGYVAIASSYRGIGGSEGKNEDTKGEIDDVLNAITYAKTLPYVDTSRTVMLGHSHGGSIALHAAARDPAIKAIVTYAAPTELADLYRYWAREGKTDPRFEDLTTGSSIIGGTPDEVPAAWKERSALYLASKIKCPVMLVQGGRDRIVPSEQADRMATALRAAGNTQVELVIDPDGGHPFDKATFAHIEKRVLGFLNARVGLPAPQ